MDWRFRNLVPLLWNLRNESAPSRANPDYLDMDVAFLRKRQGTLHFPTP